MDIGIYSCPACNAEVAAEQSQCRCGQDLTLLQQCQALADVWFNRALEALGEDRAGRALEWLSASCVARPTDAVACRALAKLWAQLGCWQEAAEALERAARLDPNAAEIDTLQRALRRATAVNVSAAAGPRRRSRKARRSKRRKGVIHGRAIKRHLISG